MDQRGLDIAQSTRNSALSLPLNIESNASTSSLGDKAKSLFRGLFRRSKPRNTPASSLKHVKSHTPQVPDPFNDIPSEPILTESPCPTPDQHQPSTLTSITQSNPTYLDVGPSTPETLASPQIPNQEHNPESEAIVPIPVTEGGSREKSWQGIARTTFNGFKQALDLAAESSDAFAPLKSVLGGIRSVLKTLEQHADNKEDLISIGSRVKALEAMKFPENVDAKAAGRNDLLPKFNEICVGLQEISEQNTVEMIANIARDKKMIEGWLSDLTNALTDYQISMHHESLRMGSETIQRLSRVEHGIINNDQKEHLDKLPRAKDAGFRSGDRQRCLEGTREDILKEIISWACDLNNRRVYWLSGQAGSGKSTISQSLAESCDAHEILGSSFFCARGSQDRSNLKLIFPTLAFDLAYRYPAFREALVPVISANPNAGHESLSAQLETLLIGPLKESGISTIIVIDAIDECRDEKATSSILSVLGRHVDDLSSTKFFITGRPEPRIKSGFSLPLLRSHTDVFQLWDVEKALVDHDIELYFRAQFSEIVEERGDIQFPNPWPDEVSLKSLVQRAGGLFIFASTTCKLMWSQSRSPIKLLKQVLATPTSTDYEGQLGLDALYTQILTENHDSSRPLLDDSEQTNVVLGTVVLVLDPLSLIALASLLGMDEDDLLLLLRLLGSVICVPPLPPSPITAFHKSFPDYLLDNTRCRDPRFHVAPPEHHARLAIACLELMERKLKRNICDLPRYSMNADVGDLEERRKKNIGEALEYACTSWAQHLSQASTSTEIVAKVLDHVDRLMTDYLLCWLEVLSITGTMQMAVYSFRDAKGWLSQLELDSRGKELIESVKDCEKFVLTFFNVIHISASHIYESPIHLSPQRSIVRQSYHHLSPQLRSWNTVDDAWDVCLRRIDLEQGPSKGAIFSHKGDRVAACGGDIGGSGYVVIIEATTGVVLSTLKGHMDATASIAFSPDDSILVSGSWDGTVSLWHIQTGGLVKTMKMPYPVQLVGFSHDGSMIACDYGIWDRDLVEPVRRFTGSVDSVAWSPVKAEMVIGYHSGDIEAIDPLNGTRWKLEDAKSLTCALSYSQDGTKIASAIYYEMKVYNAGTGEILHSFPLRSAVGGIVFLFSPEGEKLIGLEGGSLVAWDLAQPAQIIQFQQLSSMKSISVSPDESTIAAIADGGELSIWPMHDLDRSLEASSWHSSSVDCVTISHDRDISFLVSGSKDSIKLWDFATGVCLHTSEGHSGFVSDIAISPNLKFFASTGNSGKVMLWDRATGICLHTFEGDKLVAFSPDSSIIASETTRRTEMTYGLGRRRGAWSRNMDGRIQPAKLKFDSAVRLWRTADYTLIRTSYGHKGSVEGLAFSPDSQRLISVCSKNEIRLWEVEEGNLLGILEDSGSLGTSQPKIKISDDGTSVSLSGRGKWRRWRMEPRPEFSPTTRSIEFIPQDDLPEDAPDALYTYGNKKEWIMDRQGRRVFWLPQDRRGVGAVHGSRVGIGSENGRVAFFDFGF